MYARVSYLNQLFFSFTLFIYVYIIPDKYSSLLLLEIKQLQSYIWLYDVPYTTIVYNLALDSACAFFLYTIQKEHQSTIK